MQRGTIQRARENIPRILRSPAARFSVDTLSAWRPEPALGASITEPEAIGRRTLGIRLKKDRSGRGAAPIRAADAADRVSRALRWKRGFIQRAARD
jgi:hypothetical protein